MPYRYVPQQLGSVDPRAQTEDMGDDPVRASTLRDREPQDASCRISSTWTTKPGEDYEDLEELYGETLGMWALYMGHVDDDHRRRERRLQDRRAVRGRLSSGAEGEAEGGAAVPRRERDSNTRLARARTTSSRASARSPAAASLSNRQANVVTQLLDARRLMRLAESEELDAANAYPLTEYLGDLRRAVWGAPGSDRGSGRESSHAAARVSRAAGRADLAAGATRARAGAGSGWRWTAAADAWPVRSPRLTFHGPTFRRWREVRCGRSATMRGARQPRRRQASSRRTGRTSPTERTRFWSLAEGGKRQCWTPGGRRAASRSYRSPPRPTARRRMAPPSSLSSISAAAYIGGHSATAPETSGAHS